VDTVIPLGLIVNELISNCLKYAFPDGQKGLIQVELKEEGDELCLGVKDDGVGFSNLNRDNLGTSFGYRLIHALNQQLRATLDIDGSQGTRVEMKIKRYDKIRA